MGLCAAKVRCAELFLPILDDYHRSRTQLSLGKDSPERARFNRLKSGHSWLGVRSVPPL
jgi:hypothetical protein